MSTRKSVAKKPASARPVVKVRPVPAAEGFLSYRGRGELVPEVWLACSKDESRPVLVHPWLERVGPRARQRLFLCATDSYIAARVPVQLLDAEEKPVVVPDALLGPVPVQALVEWRKLLAGKSSYGVQLVVGPRSVMLRFPGGSRTWDRLEAKPPDMRKIIDGAVGGLDPSFAVGLNAELVGKLAKAVGVPGSARRGGAPMVLRFQAVTEGSNPALRPIVVTDGVGAHVEAGPDGFVAPGELDTVGILMPIRVSG